MSDNEASVREDDDSNSDYINEAAKYISRVIQLIIKDRLKRVSIPLKTLLKNSAVFRKSTIAADVLQGEARP